MFSFDTTLALNVLTDAFEGGMAGWSQVEEYKWMKWYEQPFDILTSKPVVNDDTVLLRVRQIGWDDEVEGAWVDLTYALWRKSLGKALDQYKHLFKIYEREGWKVLDMDYDAVSADVALQIAILGEVIYG